MSLQPFERKHSIMLYNVHKYMCIPQRENTFRHTQYRGNLSTFCSSWDPEYLAEMDLISPPKADAQSFTLEHKKRQTMKDDGLTNVLEKFL